MTNTKTNRILPAFSTADVYQAFDASWLDETICRSWVLLRLHHKTGAVCPGCKTPVTARQRASFFNLKKVCCTSCGKYFTALSGTFLSGIKLDFRQVVLMAVLLHAGFGSNEIARILKVDRTTVWHFRKRMGDTDA